MKKKSRKIGLALFFTILLLSLATVIVVFALEYTDKDTEIKWSFTPLSEKITIDGKEYPTAQIDSVTLKNQTTEFVIPTTVTSETGTVYYVTNCKLCLSVSPWV